MSAQTLTRVNSNSSDIREINEEMLHADVSGIRTVLEAGERTERRINRTTLSQIPNQLPMNNPKSLLVALIAMLFLGGGTAYGTVTSIQSKDEMRAILADHMREGHPEIKEMERNMIELQFLVKELKVLNDRIVRRADLTLLLVSYNQEMVEYIENGRKGPAPLMPSQIKQLQFELIR